MNCFNKEPCNKDLYTFVKIIVSAKNPEIMICGDFQRKNPQMMICVCGMGQ
jgi:hypothetical protein